MKILVVADWEGVIYAQSVADSFENIGHSVYRFPWRHYFKLCQYTHSNDIKCSFISSVYYRFQNKFLLGPVLNRINKDLLSMVVDIQPDLIFIYRGTHIFPKTLSVIRSISNSIIFAYNNDDPFSNLSSPFIWRHYLSSLKFYHHIFSYREKNIVDYKNLGFTNTSLLPSYFIKSRNYPINITKNNSYTCDVIFIGHFEPDGRDDILRFLLENKINLKIYGQSWINSKHYSFFKSVLGDINPIFDDYNLAINSSKIALVFFSKINNDVYTRRCFEIPASQTFMLTEYSHFVNDHLFPSPFYSDFFIDKFDALKKIIFYLEHNDIRDKISRDSYLRLNDMSFEISDFCSNILSVYKDFCNE